MTRGGGNGHPSKKNWILDGRLRCNPDCKDGSQFCLYFAIERREKMFNLSIGYVTYTISTEMTMPDGKNFQKKIPTRP